MWQISKTFDFCYGHRVWSQQLNPNFSDDNACSCRYLHGHNANVCINLSADNLNNSGMVTDFKHLDWFKKWLKDYIDHKFIIDINDPLLKTIIHNKAYKDVFFGEKKIAQSLDIEHHIEKHLKEYYESFIIVNFIPTSENLSKWIYEIVSYKMNTIKIKVSSVEFFETSKSKSIFFDN